MQHIFTTPKSVNQHDSVREICFASIGEMITDFMPQFGQTSRQSIVNTARG